MKYMREAVLALPSSLVGLQGTQQIMTQIIYASPNDLQSIGC